MAKKDDASVEPVKATDPTDPNAKPVSQEHGAQVHLTGIARAAARGAMHGSIEHNTMARDAAIGRGEAADGTTVDGSTVDGRLPPDVVGGDDEAVYGAPGEGEGKEGFRPGDEEVAKAKASAAAKRDAAKE